METKIGQKVLVKGTSGTVYKVSVVSEETKACWRVDNSLYNKKDLNLRGRSEWSDAGIVFATEEEIEEALAKLNRHRLLKELDLVNLRKLSDGQIEQILKWSKEQTEAMA